MPKLDQDCWQVVGNHAKPNRNSYKAAVHFSTTWYQRLLEALWLTGWQMLDLWLRPWQLCLVILLWRLPLALLRCVSIFSLRGWNDGFCTCHGSKTHQAPTQRVVRRVLLWGVAAAKSPLARCERRSVVEGLRFLHGHDVAHGAIRGPRGWGWVPRFAALQWSFRKVLEYIMLYVIIKGSLEVLTSDYTILKVAGRSRSIDVGQQRCFTAQMWDMRDFGG